MTSPVRPATRRRRSRAALGRTVVLNAVGLVGALLFFFPVYWMVTSSIKPGRQLLSRTYDLVPNSVTLDNYVTAVTRPGFLTYLRNSVLVTVSAVLFSILVATMAAAVLSRMQFPGKRGFVLLIMVVQLAPFEALLIPLYLLMRDLDLLDQLPSLILIYFVSTLPFTVWTLRGFVDGIPVELEEAAQIDGCSRMKAFWRITFPLLAPGLVATSIYAFITAWNEYLYAYVFMGDQSKYTLPVWLSTFRTAFGADWGAIMAASTLFTLPVLVFFAVVQRRMVGGLVSGSVKG